MSFRYLFLTVVALGVGRVSAAETKAAPAATPPAAAPAAPASGKALPEASTRGNRGNAAAAPRVDTAVTPTASFDTFRLISDRNIFSPYRTGNGRRDRGSEENQPRTDTITLVGTAADKGQRAFFDGSAPGYRKTLRVGDTIDQFKITRISPHVVDFERDGKAVSLSIGQQLRRPDGGEWSVIGEDIARREQQARGSVRDTGGAAAKAAEIPADADPVLRRLMEARQKQLKQ